MEALTKISAPSGPFVSSDPGWMFSVVAVKLPNPIPKGGRKIILCPCSFAPLWGWLFFTPFCHDLEERKWDFIHLKELCKTTIANWIMTYEYSIKTGKATN